MRQFAGGIAVVTGGGSGIGRALVRELAREGCHVAACDIREPELSETRRLALADAPAGVRVTTLRADVADAAAVLAFRDDTAARHGSDHVHFVFNNAGVAGGGSFVADPVAAWERTFDVCWGGVYRTARAFLPMLVRADAGVLVNVSSVNGFWATLGPQTTHTAYSAAKFAVKGFTEALIGDLRIHAPHVSAVLVMPGHVGTSIAHNTVAEFAAHAADEDRREMLQRADDFRGGGLTPEQAAAIILDGVRDGRWRILVGLDAEVLDRAVRAAPEDAYEPAFYNGLAGLAAAASG